MSSTHPHCPAHPTLCFTNFKYFPYVALTQTALSSYPSLFPARLPSHSDSKGLIKGRARWPWILNWMWSSSQLTSWHFPRIPTAPHKVTGSPAPFSGAQTCLISRLATNWHQVSGNQTPQKLSCLSPTHSLIPYYCADWQSMEAAPGHSMIPHIKLLWTLGHVNAWLLKEYWACFFRVLQNPLASISSLLYWWWKLFFAQTRGLKADSQRERLDEEHAIANFFTLQEPPSEGWTHTRDMELVLRLFQQTGLTLDYVNWRQPPDLSLASSCITQGATFYRSNKSSFPVWSTRQAVSLTANLMRVADGNGISYGIWLALLRLCLNDWNLLNSCTQLQWSVSFDAFV